MTEPSTFSLALPNETATAHLMADLALLVGPGDVITLSGDLGAGKTAAARAMIRYLAGDEALEVPSPTFTLAQAYDLPPFPLVHADLYRVNDPERTGGDRPVAVAGRHDGADRMAGARAPAHCPPTASTSRSAIARRWDRPPAPPKSPATASAAAQVARLQGAAAISRRCRLCRRKAPAHGRRCLDAFLCAAGARRRQRHPDELAAAA